jgi:hypothetical protein
MYGKSRHSQFATDGHVLKKGQIYMLRRTGISLWTDVSKGTDGVIVVTNPAVAYLDATGNMAPGVHPHERLRAEAE